MLPNDINMLVSFLNTKLRDDDMSLEHLLEINDINLCKNQLFCFLFGKSPMPDYTGRSAGSSIESHT